MPSSDAYCALSCHNGVSVIAVTMQPLQSGTADGCTHMQSITHCKGQDVPSDSFREYLRTVDAIMKWICVNVKPAA
ncbi:hypothetical protein IG631_22140 [Alternaria alternata]|nr:hypothetical protein IG631_22140 [Alternaria alternata]